MTWLPYTWAAIIAFGVLMYLILDGFTLGTGMLMPWMTRDERSIAMSVILPNWDGNQTWLVLGAASLYGAFPAAFSILLPTLYMPMILMVIMLLFRGVVFEFRLKSKSGRRRWDFLFAFSSLCVAFIQGTVLGNMIQGFGMGANHVWLTPFSILTGVTVINAYTLIGATRLILKTDGALKDKVRRYTTYLTLTLAGLLVAVSFASLYTHPKVHDLWLNTANWAFLAPFPIITGLAFIAILYGAAKNHDRTPYWAMVLVFLCSYAGFALDIFPYIVPYQLTIVQAASPANTLEFILVGAVIMLPVLLIYTGMSYRIFKGKINDIISY